MFRKITLQYYYKVQGCSAKESGDDVCRCWHDEGTKMFSSSRYNDEDNILDWRVKPRVN